MVTYKYRAQDENGKAISGTMQATDELDLHERLKQEKKYLIQAKAQADKVNIKRLRSDVVSEFAKNIGELLRAGVTLVKALRIISEDESIKPKEREVYTGLLKQVRSGVPLSEAMSASGDAFPPLFINMIKSTSLAFVCAVVEMTAQGKLLASRNVRYFTTASTWRTWSSSNRAPPLRMILFIIA